MTTETPQMARLVLREEAMRYKSKILRDANIALTENLSLEKVLETLLDYLGKLIPYDSANVMLRSEDSKFVVTALRGYSDPELTRSIVLDAHLNSIMRQICETKKTLVVPDTHKEPEWAHHAGAAHVRNWLGVPLVSSGQVIGLYSVDKIEPNYFQSEHARAAETLAARAASAIHNAQLFEQTQRYVAELEERISERKQAEIALRESEERYRELFENARDAIYVHDLKGTYVRINKAAERLSGYTREEIVEHNLWEFIPPEHVGHVREHFCTKLAQTGETTYEVDMITRSGHRVPVEVSSRAIYENGALVGVQGMVRDITERKWAQDALQMFSRRLIEAQEEERRRIARELHDQIGQVLTAVKMNLHTVQQVWNSPETRSYVKDNIEAVDQALRLVRDLSVDLRPPVLDDLGLATALQWYVDRYTSRTGLKVEVVVEMPDQNERFSRERETACFRIAQEALTNVVRHANARKVRVKLAKAGDVLLLAIKDDGVGFDLESVRHRAPRAATLGLCSMHERAHAAGGTIEIDSKISEGTEIRFSLPIQT